METVGIIASIVAALAAIATLWFSIRTSKGSILRRIDRLEKKIHEIEFQQIQKYGLDGRRNNVITPIDEKKDRLQHRIEELRRKL